MTVSVQLPTDSFNHRLPGFHEDAQLERLALVLLGYLLDLRHFLDHQRKVSNRPLPCPGHLGIAAQGLAAEDDALIGFGWGHGLAA